MSRADPLQCWAKADPLRFVWMTQRVLNEIKERELALRIEEADEQMKMRHVFQNYPGYRALLERKVPICAASPFDEKACFAAVQQRNDSGLSPSLYIVNTASENENTRNLEKKLAVASGAERAVIAVLRELPLSKQRKFLDLLNRYARAYYSSSPKKIAKFDKCLEESKRRDERLQMALVLDALAKKRVSRTDTQGVSHDIASYGQAFM